MPSLPKPRLRRHRGSELVAPAEQRERQPAVEIVEGSGLRWINIDRPTPIETAWIEGRQVYGVDPGRSPF